MPPGQPRDRAGDEIVVQQQPEGSRDGIGPHHAAREGRIADHEVEASGQGAARIVLAAHLRRRMHEARDAGGDRIVFDAGELAGRVQRFRQQREEQAGAHAGFQHAAAGEAEPFGGAPERPDDRLRRVVRILGRALQCRVFRRGDGGFECGTDLLPAGAEFRLAGTAEAVLRQLGGTEADEAQQLRLLVGGRGAARLFQRLRQGDRGNVVARPRRPAPGEAAVTGEMEIAAACDGLGRRRRGHVIIRVIGIVEIGRVRLRASVPGGRAPARQGGGVEQAEREVGIGRHDSLLMVAGGWAAARSRPPGSGRAERLQGLDRKGAYAAAGIGSGAAPASSSASGSRSGGPAWPAA